LEQPYDTAACVYEVNSGRQPTQGGWDQIEVEVFVNTPGVANGYVNMWINGTQVINFCCHQFIGPTDATANSGPCQSGYVSGPTAYYRDMDIFIQDSGLGTVYFDRVAAGDTRIGPVSKSSSTAPPPAPTGLLVR